MKTNYHILRTTWRMASVVAMMAACVSVFTACDKYDLDEHDPEGWDGSIYSYLSGDGNFTIMVKLIDDLGQTNVLNKTGSKTLFAADDDAFQRFFDSNDWGVKSYDQLSTSQKKLLLNGAMINNSLQISDLSSIEGPVEGQCMRRYTAQTVYDSVPSVRVSDMSVMTAEALQNNTTWKKFEGRDNILLMSDMTEQPLLVLTERFLTNNNIQNAEDYDFLFNYTTERQSGDASVNGVYVEEQNIKCSNGFIHKTQEVVTPLDNMAGIVGRKPQTSTFSAMLDRFSAPYYVGSEAVTQYNNVYGTQVDSIFQKRYISERSQGGVSLTRDDDNNQLSSIALNFDPGWNSYYQGVASPSAEVAMNKNMAVMLAPSDDALADYWENGAGRILKDQYGSWTNVPNRVIKELVSNNLLASFTNSVPSKFDGILNDANDPMGITVADVDSVWLACNGAVYLTNKVFSPTSFVSVLYPAVTNSNLRIIDWAVTQCQYEFYLNSLNSRYSFFIPSNDALLEYIDPVSYGQTETQLWRFHYDESLETPVWASLYTYDLDSRTVGDSIGECRVSSQLTSRLQDVLDAHIVIGDVEDGNTWYRTKGGQEIKVNNVSAGADGMTVEGSFQTNESQEPVRVTYIYDQTSQGNGKCYILEKEPIMSTRYSVIDIMRQHEEMSAMLELLEGSAMRETIHDESYACVSENLSLFNTYHYTVYVPTNESINALHAAGTLPTWEDVDLLEEQGRLEEKTADSLAIENFIQYHIQDNALYIGAEPQEEEQYETGKINSLGKFERVWATLTEDNLTVSTEEGSDDVRTVVKSSGLYNLQAREYQLDSSDAKNASNIYTSSSAVIHLIDGPLIK